jgi:transcriptional regulator with XRE-family HTH domain
MNKSLGEDIRDLRIKAGYTLRAFAKKTGISVAHLSDIEHGRRSPSEENLKKILEPLLGVGASWERFRRLDTRLDAETKKWVDATPGAQQILRVSKESGKSVQEILDILRKQFGESAEKQDIDENKKRPK